MILLEYETKAIMIISSKFLLDILEEILKFNKINEIKMRKNILMIVD
jgi:hypothetical protein